MFVVQNLPLFWDVTVVCVCVQASSLSLPCREMCEAVTSTCSCGQERTLGSLLDKVMDGLLVTFFAQLSVAVGMLAGPA